MSEYYNRHNRLASAGPLSNLSPVFGPSIKRNKSSDHLATRETASYVLFSAKTQIYKLEQIQKVELKSLYFQFSLRLLS